jgi:hypothetical protein
VADGDHHSVSQPALQVASRLAGDDLPLGLRVRACRRDDRLDQPEGLAQLALEVHVQPGRRGQPDLHHADAPGPLEQALDLGPRQPEPAGQGLLGQAILVVAEREPGEELVLFGAKVVERRQRPLQVSKCSMMGDCAGVQRQ